MPSYETTMALSARRAALDKLRDHKLGCHECGRTRRRGDGCSVGVELARAASDAMEEVKRQRVLDSQPPPNMDTLF